MDNHFKIFYIVFFILSCSDSHIHFKEGAPFSFKKLQTKNKIIYSEDILTQIQGYGSGYFLKNIILKDSENIAKIKDKPPNLSIHISKTGNFMATLHFGHRIYPDVILKNCLFEISSDIFNFRKLSKKQGSSKIIKSSEILSAIPQNTRNYILKNIILENRCEKKLATIGGIPPNLQINLEKIGQFTAILILEHKFYVDVILKNAIFEYHK